MKEKVEKPALPKISGRLPGTVVAQAVRCGKPNCKCARGELHGPHYYRMWRDEGGRQHKQYVHREDLDAVRAACAAERGERLRVVELIKQGEAALAWLAGDNDDSPNTPDDVERMLAYPANARALLEVIVDDEISIRMRARAVCAVTQWSRRQSVKQKSRRLLRNLRLDG